MLELIGKLGLFCLFLAVMSLAVGGMGLLFGHMALMSRMLWWAGLFTVFGGVGVFTYVLLDEIFDF